MQAYASAVMPASRSISLGGWVLIVGGVLGTLIGLLLAVVPGMVGKEAFSYPLTAAGHAATQVFLFVHHVAIAYGLYVVWRSGFAGKGKLAAVGGIGSVVVMALFGVHEFVVAGLAEAVYPSAQIALAEAVYGVLSILIGAMLIVFGIAAMRGGQLHGWRRWIILILDVYIFVPLLPLTLVSFETARIAIALWNLLFAVLGSALLRSERKPVH
ncbi:hypothetical protein [Gulosibacter molinativorax]|uniref:DUF4386 domain-containing protein n=1 Tax=Gulosibacter molinativorax TaxID=256821 RepID=A0ABT7C8Z1_9MICO|nr:hypothetical protein [Gulosibacter molinativorax]MDJ1371681.1 hypothetical protein [Gulosibacter molinativorax]QUY63103.1 Hypotetical protein [Gulosibacter molinativorax]